MEANQDLLLCEQSHKIDKLKERINELNKWVHSLMKVSLFTDIEIDGIDHDDYPKFCDAYACSASYDGREATDEELDWLNEYHPDLIHELVYKQLF